MQTLAFHPIHTIFTKTAKGHDEIVQRRFGLTARQRRALIVMDGKKTVSSIAEMMPEDELEEIVSFLAGQGFIVPASVSPRKTSAGSFGQKITHESTRSDRSVAAKPSQPTQVPKRIESGESDKAALLQDPEKIRQVKDFMTTTATTYLGLLSADVIHRIERAKGAEQLMMVIGHWHMALRESKQGNRFAGPYLEQVTIALTGKGVQIKSHHD